MLCTDGTVMRRVCAGTNKQQIDGSGDDFGCASCIYGLNLFRQTLSFDVPIDFAMACQWLQ
jgi:hypothetical protein